MIGVTVLLVGPGGWEEGGGKNACMAGGAISSDTGMTSNHILLWHAKIIISYIKQLKCCVWSR